MGRSRRGKKETSYEYVCLPEWCIFTTRISSPTQDQRCRIREVRWLACLARAIGVGSVQQLVTLPSERGSEVIGIDGLNFRIFVRLSQRSLLVQAINLFHALARNVWVFALGLPPAAQAPTSARHDFDKMKIRVESIFDFTE